MSDCPSCGAELKSKICPCGYAVRPTVTRVYRHVPEDPSAGILPEVAAYVSEYRARCVNSDNREACLSFLQKRGLRHMVPQHIIDGRTFDNAMDDYRAEAEA